MTGPSPAKCSSWRTSASPRRKRAAARWRSSPRPPDHQALRTEHSSQLVLQRLAHPPALVRGRHPKSREQFLLARERQAGYLPAHDEALEQQLGASLPQVLAAGRRRALQVAQLRQRLLRQGVPQRQDVALAVRVVGRGDRLAGTLL